MGMTKKDLIAAVRQDVASQGAVISKQTVKDVLASLAAIITQELAHGSKVVLPGVGKIKVAGKKVKKAGKTKATKKLSAFGGAADGFTRSGRYVGKILSIDGDEVIQKVGRTLSETVRHDIGMLTRKPVVGEVVTIEYKGKVGTVTD